MYNYDLIHSHESTLLPTILSNSINLIVSTPLNPVYNHESDLLFESSWSVWDKQHLTHKSNLHPRIQSNLQPNPQI